MSFTPYIYFDGRCEEAMCFYADVFGAEAPAIMRYRDAPDTEGLEASDRVMYSHIMLGDRALMASDVPVGSEHRPQQSVSVHHEVATIDEGKAKFNRLAEGGEITMPYGPSFFSPGFGMCRDRFGTHWMIGMPATGI
jgi:PhnB protein